MDIDLLSGIVEQNSPLFVALRTAFCKTSNVIDVIYLE